MIPTTVRLAVGWAHIREAERRGRRVTPVELALVEQSRFARLELAPDAVLLVDAATGQPVRYAAGPELAVFLQDFVQGGPSLPALFILQLKP
jgi:hypothetical protein